MQQHSLVNAAGHYSFNAEAGQSSLAGNAPTPLTICQQDSGFQSPDLDIRANPLSVPNPSAFQCSNQTDPFQFPVD